MDELKEKIAAIVEAELEPYTHLACMAAGKAADRILSIPEIAEALACKAAFEDVKTQRTIINYVEGKLGPSISTNKRTPV